MHLGWAAGRWRGACRQRSGEALPPLHQDPSDGVCQVEPWADRPCRACLGSPRAIRASQSQPETSGRGGGGRDAAGTVVARASLWQHFQHGPQMGNLGQTDLLDGFSPAGHSKPWERARGEALPLAIATRSTNWLRRIPRCLCRTGVATPRAEQSRAELNKAAAAQANNQKACLPAFPHPSLRHAGSSPPELTQQPRSLPVQSSQLMLVIRACAKVGSKLVGSPRARQAEIGRWPREQRTQDTR